ncbi:MAG: hypothetical protein VX125_12850 [Pseudomonadota bacterium]|uniref:hypothetical protein n=1 Tax=Acinetobacter seifertii TaxID=1530123 RepID=UPI001BAD6DF4|nr:hypothetical protein [Acinetobacter seifertii]MEC8124713.1 hypothetical protein [Pseudomonadota bacterium]
MPEQINESIIPYVPIADRVEASNDKSQLLCQQFFNMIDHCVRSQIMFNHDTAHGCLSIAPDQINDLLAELSKTDHLNKVIDIHALKDSLSDLIYPKFNGIHTITSPIWNQTEVTVWQFQLNQIANGVDMEHIENDAELNLDMALSSIRIWRNSLEIGSENKDVIYKQNDLVYKLMDIEERLKIVQHSLEE